MIKCEICQEKLVNSKEGYYNHMKRFHGVEEKRMFIPSALIKPERTTTRSKAQIVHDMEKTWGNAVIPAVMPWHSLGGR